MGSPLSDCDITLRSMPSSVQASLGQPQDLSLRIYLPWLSLRIDNAKYEQVWRIRVDALRDTKRS